uniref:Uncharacterized protein n=1 Tax=Myoviridae sp. cte0t5 TaxID=2823549 RepID=A0A8S5LH19_9CAUD|nr:MAG TPA: hypothetical protein [Myoviridae sp. cte0t5]
MVPIAGVPALAVGPARARRGLAAPCLCSCPCLCSKGAGQPPRHRPATDPPQAATDSAIVPVGLSYEWTALRSRSLWAVRSDQPVRSPASRSPDRPARSVGPAPMDEGAWRRAARCLAGSGRRGGPDRPPPLGSDLRHLSLSRPGLHSLRMTAYT